MAKKSKIKKLPVSFSKKGKKKGKKKRKDDGSSIGLTRYFKPRITINDNVITLVSKIISPLIIHLNANRGLFKLNFRLELLDLVLQTGSENLVLCSFKVGHTTGELLLEIVDDVFDTLFLITLGARIFVKVLVVIIVIVVILVILASLAP